MRAASCYPLLQVHAGTNAIRSGRILPNTYDSRLLRVVQDLGPITGLNYGLDYGLQDTGDGLLSMESWLNWAGLCFLFVWCYYTPTATKQVPTDGLFSVLPSHDSRHKLIIM